MRVLAISLLFPNSVYPNRGIFVLNRLRAVSRYADVKVINPIAWFPFCSRLERYKDYHRIPKKETIDGIEVYHPRFLSIPLVLKVVVAVTYCLAVLPVALRLRKKWRYDLVDLHWTFPDLPAGRLLSWLLGVRQLVTVRGTPALFPKERSPRRALVRILLAKSDHVVTLSDELRDLSVSQGVSKDRISTIRNGVDVSRFRYLEIESCRARLGIPADQRTILGIGYVTPRKGFDRIIASLPEVLKECPEAKLYLLGPDGSAAQGDCGQELKRLIESLNIKDRVHFVGEVPNQDLILWYNAADCFCLSSRSEGCPNVLLEALACGCPVVATAVGSVPEVVTDESMGMVVPNSTEGVRSGLLSVLSTSYDREKTAAQMEMCDWDWCARQVVEIYTQLLRQPTDVCPEPNRQYVPANEEGETRPSVST